MRKYFLSPGILLLAAVAVFLFYFKQPVSITALLPADIAGDELDSAALFEVETISFNEEQNDRSNMLFIDLDKEVILIEDKGKLESFTVMDASEILVFVYSSD
ncbi:hypothetical protein ACTHOQ_05710 [Solibacillus silvestris]|uniref:hypothetical protein n=1 Tax=Solibacillus silvestris TaxID=76853 RepID=UPI003F810886